MPAMKKRDQGRKTVSKLCPTQTGHFWPAATGLELASLATSIPELQKNKSDLTSIFYSEVNSNNTIVVTCRIRMGLTVLHHGQNVFHFLYKNKSKNLFCVFVSFRDTIMLLLLASGLQDTGPFVQQDQHFLSNIKLTFCHLISGSVIIAWTLVKIFLGLQHALFVGPVSVFMRSEELEIFIDRSFKVVDPVQAVIDR